MEQTGWVLGSVKPIESARSRARGAPLTVTIDITDPEVLAELRRRPEGEERDRFVQAALRVGVLALRAANGQDAAAIREAGTAMVSEAGDSLRAPQR